MIGPSLGGTLLPTLSEGWSVCLSVYVVPTTDTHRQGILVASLITGGVCLLYLGCAVRTLMMKLGGKIVENEMTVSRASRSRPPRTVVVGAHRTDALKRLMWRLRLM